MLFWFVFEKYDIHSERVMRSRVPSCLLTLVTVLFNFAQQLPAVIVELNI